MNTSKAIIVGSGLPDSPDEVSYSQLSMMDRCPAQYEYRYVKGMKEPPAFALGLGSAFHSSIEVQHRHKMKTGKNLSSDDMADVVSDVWKLGAEFGGSRDNKAYIPWKKVAESDDRLTISAARKTLEDATLFYHSKQAVQITPGAVEAKVLVPFQHGKSFVAYIDVVDVGREGVVAIDMKFAGKKYEPNAARSSPQLGCYGMVQKLAGGTPFDGGCFHVVTKTKTPELQVLKTDFNAKRLDATFYWASTLHDQIMAGRFPGRIGTHCNWCGYNKVCPWYNGKGFGAVEVMPTVSSRAGKPIQLTYPKRTK